MSQPFLAEIIMFGGNFAPRGWALCQGQILAISQNTALFSLLGTTYGGNGQTTFALPDFRGRSPVGQGQGPGLANVDLGEQGGSENNTLTLNNLPQHTHPFSAPSANTAADATKPNGNVPAQGGSYTSVPNGVMGAGNTGIAGGSQPFSLRNPYLGINFIIALQGVFPSRN